MKYRKTSLIEAVRWAKNDNAEHNEVGNDSAALFLGDYYGWIIGPGTDPLDPAGYLIIHTLEGDHKAHPGDWLAKGIKGECWPIKADIFDATYEPVL